MCQIIANGKVTTRRTNEHIGRAGKVEGGVWRVRREISVFVGYVHGGPSPHSVCSTDPSNYDKLIERVEIRRVRSKCSHNACPLASCQAGRNKPNRKLTRKPLQARLALPQIYKQSGGPLQLRDLQTKISMCKARPQVISIAAQFLL